MIIQALYFMLPAYFANMAPVFVLEYFKKLGVPINEQLFGVNKTWRGFFSAIILSWIVIYIQKLIGWNSLVDYSVVNIWLLGFLLGFGALFGDLVESYFKRKQRIPAGQPWKVFDQLDFPLGAMMFASFMMKFTGLEFVVILIGSFILTVIVNHVGYYLGVRKVRW